MPPNNGTVPPLRILLLEDHAADADLVIAELRRSGVQANVKVVGTRESYLENLDPAFDAIISDFHLPQFDAKEALALLQAQELDIPFIVVSGAIGEETAVDLMKLGAADYLLKDRLARLPQALEHAVHDRALRLERRTGRNELRESEERMRAILESALDAVITMDRGGRIVDFNPAAEEIFGFRRDTAIGERLVDLIIPERMREDHNRGLELYLKTGEARMLGRRVEVTALRADGLEFPAEMAVTRIGSHEPPMFTAFLRDIGEKLRAQMAVRDSQERLQTVIANLREGLIISDMQGELLDWNPAALEMHGITSADQCRFRLAEYARTFELSTLEGTVLPIEEWPHSRIFRHEAVRNFEARIRRIGTDWERVFSFGGAPFNDAVWGQLAFVAINDITEQKSAEEKLRRQEKQYRVLFATYPSPTWVYDAETLAFLAVNDAAVDHYGYSREQFLAMRISEIRPPEDVPAYLESGTVSSEKAQAAGVWRHVKKNGEILLADIFASAIQFEGHRAQLVIAIDVTAQRQAENARREADEHLTNIINSVDGIVWETDDETNRMTFISEKAEEILGYPTARWLAEPGFWRSHMHPDDLEKTIADSDATNGHSEPRELEYRMVSAAGREVWFKDRVSVVDLAGRTIKHRGIMLDVTERKRAEEIARAGELRIQEQARLLDLAQDAIMVRDMEDRVEYWNLGAEKLYGWTAAEVEGGPASALIWKSDPSGAATRRTAALENGSWVGECRHSCKDGRQVTVRSRWTVLWDESGAPKSFLIINTDITEQKKIEEQFMRAQRLESIGTLASGVAHDLNNVLAPILMGAAVLRRSQIPAADEAILSAIETCAQRGADIVKQVLTFARGEEGAHLLLQPAHLINDMAKVAKGAFPKSITVRTHYLDPLWPVEGDPTQFHQILLNLCVNARDAMPAGGTLSLSATNFPVDEHYASMTLGAKAGPYVLFEVKDTGMGIPRQIIDQIFDPFFTTKEVGLGTGLGLSTVVGIVKGHGGFLTVESDIGKGTSFKVYLPARIDALTSVKESEPIALPRANGELILVVDDENLILKVAREVLERHGYAVVTALDAPEALAIFAARREEIQLVLTDLAMPLMDGIALIRTLQKMKPDVCIIASTGKRSLEQGLHELPGLNVRACLTKPYNKEMLLSTLGSALGHRNATA
jgi:PAS domain S-box-containing protein